MFDLITNRVILILTYIFLFPAVAVFGEAGSLSRLNRRFRQIWMWDTYKYNTKKNKRKEF